MAVDEMPCAMGDGRGAVGDRAEAAGDVETIEDGHDVQDKASLSGANSDPPPRSYD